MKVSVIIPTYNRKEKIDACVSSILGGRIPDELIVVIDGSTDNTLEHLRKLQHKHGDLTRIMKLVDQPNSGRAAARNKGVEKSTGDLLIFFDDDMIVDSQCIEQHVKQYMDIKDSVLTGQIELLNKCKSDFDKFRVHLDNQWKKNIPRGKFQVDKDQFVFSTGNLSLSRKIFEEIGGFNESLSDAEDFEFCMDLFKCKIKVFYSDLAKVTHDDLETIDTFIRRQRSYEDSRKKIYENRPHDVELIPHGFVFKKHTFKNLFGKTLFSYNSVWKIVMKYHLLNLLPIRKLRYRIYSLLIYYSI